MGVINLGLSAEYHGSRVTVDVSHVMIDLVWKFANATPPGNPSQHTPHHISVVILRM